jgi:serine/threonine protein kinase
VKVNTCNNVGVYGKITTVKLTESNNDKLFAMKIIDKSKIKEESLLQSSYLQTGILTDDNPFVAKILHVSQNNLNIYIVMEYVPGLDLYYYLY